MSSFSSRVFLYVWYAVLVVALVVQSNVRLQWSSRNFCGAADEVSVYHVEEWNSSACLSWEAYWVQSSYTQGVPQNSPHAPQQWVLPKRSNKAVDKLPAFNSDSLPRYELVVWPPTDAVLAASSACDSCHEAHAAGLFGQSLSSPPLFDGERGGALVRQRAAELFPWKVTPVGGGKAASLSGFAVEPSRPTMPPLRRVYKLRWTAQALSGVLNHQLNRFLHVFVSLASPLGAHEATSPGGHMRGSSAHHSLWGVSQRVYEVLVALEETSLTPGTNSSEDSSSDSAHNASKQVYTYHTTVTCWRHVPRCSNIVLPSSVVIPSNNSQFTLTLIDVDAELAEASLRGFILDRRDDVDVAAVPALRPSARAGALAVTAESSRAQKTPSLQRTFSAPTAPATSALSSAVGVMYQRHQYTIATLVFRYVFLLVTLVLMLRFLYQSRQAHRMQFEQKWTLAAQIGLIFYLNPVYWWCIYAGESTQRGGASGSEGAAHEQPLTASALSGFPHSRSQLALYYVEFHIPTYFAAFIVSYIWSIIAGSFRWHLPTNGAAASTSDSALHLPAATCPEVDRRLSRSGLNELVANRAPASPARLTVPSSRVARFRVRVLLVVFFVLVTSLDVTKCYLEEASVGEGRLTCTSSMCLLVDKCISYLLLCGVLSSGVGLYWLRRNLARHPYLSTRPQQLACRIMIFMYFTGCIYSVAQVMLLDVLYAQLLGIIYYRPLVQFSPLLVLTTLVNHMTYVYTTTQSSLEIPLRPSDPRWKCVGWSKRWYRWLNSHGGSLYVFFSEAEERLFYEVQVAYQQAKHTRKMAKKRKTSFPRDVTQTARPQEGADAGCKDTGVQGGNCFSTSPLPPAGAPDFAAAAAAAAATAGASSTIGREAAEDARFDDPSSGKEREWLPPLDISKRHDILPAITTHPSTSSANAMAMTDNGDGDENIDFHDDLRPRSAGGSFCLGDGLARTAAERIATGVVSGGGMAVSDAAPGSIFHASQIGRNSCRASSRISSRVLDAVHLAEHRLIDGTATFLDFLEETCVDRPLRVLLRQEARQSFVFFNLETAIDCLNLSHEAYAVEASRGDEYIRTGIQVNAAEVPKAALGFAERVAMTLFGLWFKSSPHPSHAHHDGSDVDATASARLTSEDERAPLLGERGVYSFLSPARDPSDAEVASSANRAIQPQLAAAAAAALAPSPPPPPPPCSYPGIGSGQEDLPIATGTAAPTTADCISGVSGPSGAAAAGGSSFFPSSCKGAESSPTSAWAGTANAGAGSGFLPPLNVEQYGYHRVAVLEARGVQVVVARMDASGTCPVHVGKVPRLIIAFRGTDNVANAMEDIRFRQRTWKEMETPTLSARASVHSGFLELWMSLKRRVIDVVLRELRSQCAPDGEPIPAVSAGDPTCPGGNSANTAATGSWSPAGGELHHTAVPFSATWMLPRSTGGRDRVDTDRSAFDRQQGGSEGFMRIYVTGHSLGGALASLCAYTLRRMLLLIRYPEPDLVVYTFGQPRIGNSVFKQYYNRAIPCTFRVVNESDAVSGFNFFGGHHVGVQVNIDRHGNYVCKPMHIERMFSPTRGGGFALSNHSIAAYANSLNAMADVYSHGACPLRCCRPYMDEIESLSSTDSEEGRPQY
ncbi:hypothetical protein JKF63_00546 [Porcisia hertigi]|uniref:Uncharacterized protein n=1 Tax=Porcisia hertigi TaxID=2761500 RepID=A0A836HBU0_9TRYP|nr:hypothetical protein JKF63_00546 [Porcisia hertigi]